MASPSKRLKMSPPPALTPEADFVSLDTNDIEESTNSYGYDNNSTTAEPDLSNAPRGPRAATTTRSKPHRRPAYLDNGWFIRRNAQDRPRSKHALPGHEPWILVKTKFGRRFVHNTESKESLWWIPDDVMPGVREFERLQRLEKEKAANAQWAEEQLQEMRSQKADQTSKADDAPDAGDGDGSRRRRRRSESLQREDEEAMMAELAAEEQHAEEKDAKAAVEKVADLQPQTVAIQQDGYGSDSSYEEVEVTDSEGEEDEAGDTETRPSQGVAGEGHSNEQLEQPTDDPVEFGEDDIAYQLAAMGEDYGLDPGEYGSDEDGEWEEGAEGLGLSSEEAANLFHELLDDHNISPFTPWEKLIEDDSPGSILMDDRYTVLPSTRARKEVWESWVKSRAAQIQEERAKQEKRNPRIPYLAFLAAHATPKLYWPEFKRKFKKEAVMTDRHLSDRDREKLYRDHIARLKLPESSRVADLQTLLDGLPPGTLSRKSSLDALPEAVLASLHYISLPAHQRDKVVEQRIARLPAAG